MSPAVVDFRSPITSPQQTQSRQPPSFQNPNHDSSKHHHFGSLDSNNQSEQGHSSSVVDSDTVNSLNIGNVGDVVFNCSFPSPFASRVSSEKSNLSGISARSRPRFLKVRKQSSSHHGRSTSVSAQKDSFLNPFRSASENLNRVEDAPGASNGFSGSVSDVKFGKFHDVGLAFGTKKSDSVLNSNSEGSEFCGSEGKSDAGGFGKFNNVNFVFGINNSVSSLNSNLEKTECGQSAEKWGTDNFGKPHNVSFGFTNVSFMFDSNQAKSESKLNSEIGEPRKNVEYSDGKEKTEENKSEFRKVDNVDFVFSSNYKDSVSSSNLWKKEYSKNIGKDATGKMKLDTGGDSGKFGYAGFVFGAGWSDLRSNSDSERIESNENGGKSVFSDCGNMKSTAQLQKFDNLGFVFGSNQNDSASNADLENKEFRRSAEEFNFIDSGKMNVDIETKLQKEEVHGVFLGGSGSKETSSINGSCKLSDGLNELNSERAESCNGYMKWQTNNTCSVNNKNTFVFGSSSSSLGNAFGKSPVFKVSDEMQALNINDSEKVDGAGTTKGSTTNSCVNVNHMFVFGSNNKKSDFSTGSSGISSCDHKYANIAHPGNGCVFEKIDGVYIKTNIKKVFAFGDNEKTAGTFGGSVQNTMNDEIRNTEPRFGNSSCSLCGTLGKENQPVNLTKKSSDGGQYTGNQPNNDPERNKASFPSSSSSMGFNFQPYSSVSEAPAIDRVEKDKLSFTSTTVGLGESFTGFSTPDLNLPYSFTANLFPGLSKKLEFSANSRSVREGRLKKRRGKLRQHTPVQQWTGQNHLSKEGSSQQYQESPGCSSPMDFSPCQDAGGAPSATHSTVSTTTKDEDLAAAIEEFDINEGDNKCREPNGKDYGDHFESCFAPECPVEEFVARAENGEVSSQTDNKTQFCFVSTSETSENPGERKFSFSASSSAHDNLSVTGRQYRKKYRMKIGHGSNITTPSRKVDLLNSESKGETISKADEEHAKQESTEAATLEACKTWRIRGNQAYKNGDLSIAEDFYTKGIDSIPCSKISACCIEPLVLCYSNRAATRLSLGRVREALGDCRMASTLDPYFLKVHMRAANCHLLLGEVEDALQFFSKCLESGTGVCLDRRITIEAADGLRKAQKVIECTNSSAELLKQRTSDAASNALGIIADALSISCYSEKLLEMRGEALCMLQKYEEVVQLCERTLDFAEKNFTAIGPANPLSKVDGSESKNSFVRLWRWSLMSKSYFHMGKLEVALDLIEKQEQLKSIQDKYQSMTRESSISLAVTVRELLRRKNAGNEAFKFGKHTEALEHYTAAISTSVESRPFAAVCFCNRAAAHQALGQITDAIADCSLSIALDGNYTKALSRRATLHEMIRDYEQAVNDLQKFIAVLEKQSQEKSHQAGTPDRPTGSSVKDLRRARHRLSSMEEKARTEIPLDLYNILGIKASDTAAEIKKAYRKAALRHHPDKAGQFLARCEIGHGGCWKEIAEKIHMDAHRLFKMIGEAYDVLSDPNKRSKYDVKEEMRDDEDDNVSSSFERSYNFYSSPFESRNNRRYWNESWNTYGNSYSRW